MKRSSFFEKYKMFILGDSSKYELPKRIFLLITHISLIIIFLAIVSDILLALESTLVLITVIVFIIVLLLHFHVKRSQFSAKYSGIFFVLTISALATVWIYNGGYDGNNGVLAFVYFMAMIVILPKQFRITAFIIFSILIVGLVTYQYLYPESIFSYSDEYQRFFDLALGYFLFLILGYNIQTTILNNYEHEHDIVKLKNNELGELNLKLSKTNSELESILKKVEDLNSSKDRFITVLSHDLRSPFQGIIGITKTLESEYDSMPDVERKTLLHQIGDSLHKVYSFLEELLLWGRIQKNAATLLIDTTDVKELIVNAISVLSESASHKKITINLHCQENLNAELDRELISAVIRNLISNAIKFSPIGSSVQVKAGAENNKLTISVADYGVGISGDRLVKLFDIATNLSTIGTDGEHGSGLGLILCNDIIKMHNGSITVESKIGKGSTFTIILPMNS